ncbi:daptide biosynthesis intramembrane metalloprotease [Streptomyces sp. NPDC006512]|uniref:daptide biosynthesis intramembrane metalloprotease n=1 Tax=Streptomyces sp. NPDC006512 TaxID=3154307 RepID=UPI0033BB2B01
MSATTAPPAAPAAHTRRPNRAPGTEIHPPMGDGGTWVLQRGPRYIRVTPSVADLAEHFDGERDHQDLARLMGRTWTPELVAVAVDRLDGLGLIDRGDMKAAGPDPRVKMIPPFTVQLTLLRPGRAMQALQPLFARLGNRAVIGSALLTALVGLIALAVQHTFVKSSLSGPLSPLTYLGILAGLVIGTSIHELGHAATLIRYGGRPSRIGIMLFYLMPAFFCDVSDSWRLPQRRQRVHVALAGPTVQTFLAGAAALAAWPLAEGGLKTGLVFFALGSYLTGLLNLLPFIKLDGYIALMSHVDVPYLRDRAMTDARRALARLLFGGTYTRELDTRWTTWYGLACMAFPLYLLSTALDLWIDLLQRGGTIGVCLAGSALSYALYFLVRGAQRLAGEVRAAGAAPRRVVPVTAALAAAAGALMFLPVTHTVPAAYVTRGQHTELVLLDGADTDRLAPGQQVTLTANGPVLHPVVGTAAIAAGAPGPGTAPLSSFFPISLDGAPELPVTSYRLTVDGTPGQPTGAAEVATGTLPLWEVAYRTYISPFIPS